MLKILVIPSLNLPLPPTKGGAVQSLLQMYIDHNEESSKHHITVYSVSDVEAEQYSVNYKNTTFVYNDTYSILAPVANWPKLSGKLRSLAEILWVRSIKSLLCSTDFDLVLLENTPQFAKRLKNYLPTECKLVLHLHNDWINCTNKKSIDILKAMDGIICVSDYIKKRVDSVLPNKTVTVFNGIKNIEDNINHELVETLQKKYNLSGDKTVLIYTGRLSEEKGLLFLLKAIQQIKNYNSCVLILVGGATYSANTHTKYVDMLKTEAKKCRCAVYFTGYVNANDISAYLSIADIGVLFSVCEEAFSLTVLEYMRLGLPVIATKSGGVVDVMDENCGILLDKDASLVSQGAIAIDKLLVDMQMRKKLGDNAYKKSLKFNVEEYSQRIDNALDIFAQGDYKYGR